MRSFFQTSESVTLKLKINPNSDEIIQTIHSKNLVKLSKQELERIKNIPNSVFFLKGKKGFNSSEEHIEYKENQRWY